MKHHYPDSARRDEPSIGSVETVDDDGNDEASANDDEPPMESEEPPQPRQARNPVSAVV